MPAVAQGRLIRIVDATTVTKAGPAARSGNKLWRIHAAFDLPRERFGCFELTDETGSEKLDRMPVVKGEIRIGDRVYLNAEHIAGVLADGADVIVRASWKNARWLDGDMQPLDLIALLHEHEQAGVVDQPIWIKRKSAAALGLRLVAIRKPAEAIEAARQKARREAQRGGHKILPGTLVAAEWVILVTSLDAREFSTADVFELYRLRWRVELAFKRLKSLIGLKGPPGKDERSAKPYLLAHLLMILLLEPLVDEFEDSPRSGQAVA